MSRAVRTVKDASKVYSAKLGAAGFAIVFSAWLARNLPSAELSLWPVCIALSDILQVFGGLGINDLLMRRVPSLLDDDQPQAAAALLRTGLGLVFALSLVLAIMMFFLSETVTHILLNDQIDVSLVRWLVPAVFFTGLYKNFERTLYVVDKFGNAAVISLAFSILRPSLAVLLYMSYGIIGAVFVLCAIPFLATVASVICLVPHIYPSGHTERPTPVLSRALPFYVASLANFGTHRLDYVIVGALTTPTQLAAYYIARKFAEYLRMLDGKIIEAMEPKLAQTQDVETSKLASTFSKCSRYLLLALLPVHVFVGVAAGPIVSLYAGDKYPLAGPILSILAVAVFCSVVAGLYRVNVKLFANRWHLTALDATAGIASICLSVAFVINYGAIGPALGQAGAYLAQGIVAFLVLRQTFPPHHDKEAATLATVATGAMGAVGILIVSLLPPYLSIIALAVVSPSIYFGLLIGKLSREDVRLIRQLVPAHWMKPIADLLHDPALGSP